MRSITILALVLAFNSLSAQVFWTENFGTGCNTAQLVTTFSSSNGAWTVTNTGANESAANVWYVSATENGNAAGQCGTGCGTDQTLHLGNVAVAPFVTADLGAAYYEGLVGFCGFFPCASTSKRVESPVINCSANTGISIAFVYMEGGNVIDNATLWYNDGSTWTQITDMAKTVLGCTPQGTWTSFTLNLPASANNNPNVRIGFQWINNDDGDATDPSFAVDDIEVSGTTSGADTTPPVITCPGAQVLSLGAACTATLPSFIPLTIATDNITPNPVITQSPAAGTPVTGAVLVTMTATDGAGNTATCTINVTATDQTPPAVNCTSGTVNVPLGMSCNAVIPSYVSNVALSDNCTPSGSLVVLQNPAVGTVITTATLVTVTATDAANNSSSCTYTVVPQDQTPFVINCPGSITVAVAIGETNADVTVPLPTFSDNCTQSVVFTNSFNGSANASGNYPLGTTTVTFTGTNNLSETDDCTFQIVVTDAECCPPDLNCDGYVGVSDLLIFNANFGCLTGCVGDINGDGLVTVADLLIFTAAFGTFCP